MAYRMRKGVIQEGNCCERVKAYRANIGGECKMKRILFLSCALGVVLILSISGELRAEGIGVPHATLEQGTLSIDLEGTIVDREIEQDLGVFLPLAGITLHRDNEHIRSHRLYAKMSYGFYNDPSDGFLKGLEGFIRLGAANLTVEDMFLDDTSAGAGSAAGYWNTNFTGAYELAVGGGVKGTLYKQGPLNVGLTLQTVYFETEDKLEFFDPILTTTRLQEADISVLETDAALAASYELDTGAFGVVTPYLGVVTTFIDGDVDYNMHVHIVGTFYHSRWHSYNFREESPLGALVGVDWRIAEFAHVGAEATFYGDGNSATVWGGVSF
jgi:hypothetical protein